MSDLFQTFFYNIKKIYKIRNNIVWQTKGTEDKLYTKRKGGCGYVYQEICEALLHHADPGASVAVFLQRGSDVRYHHGISGL